MYSVYRTSFKCYLPLRHNCVFVKFVIRNLGVHIIQVSKAFAYKIWFEWKSAQILCLIVYINNSVKLENFYIVMM